MMMSSLKSTKVIITEYPPLDYMVFSWLTMLKGILNVKAIKKNDERAFFVLSLIVIINKNQHSIKNIFL